MELSKKLMGDIKAALETDHGRAISKEEAQPALDFLRKLAAIQLVAMLNAKHEKC